MATQFAKLVPCRHFLQRPRPLELGFESIYYGVSAWFRIPTCFYHMGIYAMPELESWFRVRYAEAVPTKLDMGKSCIRFKNPKHIPYNLIGELVSKVSVDDWISVYQSLKK